MFKTIQYENYIYIFQLINRSLFPKSYQHGKSTFIALNFIKHAITKHFLSFWMFTNIIIIDVIRNIFLSWHVVWMITLYILLLLTIDDAWRDLWQHTRAEKWCRPIIYEILWNTFFETIKWIFISYSKNLQIHFDLRFHAFQ